MKYSDVLKKSLKPFKNIFFVVILVFIVWMLAFDANSWLIHRELNNEIDKLNLQKKFYNSKIKEDQQEIKNLNSTEGIEKYGREHYYMKKNNEEIFIIQQSDSAEIKEK